ncbi:hypothetical protein [Streptomyces flavofungini]
MPVAVEHAGTGPGRVVFLCATCRYVMRVVPLAEHPEDSDGFVIFLKEDP